MGIKTSKKDFYQILEKSAKPYAPLIYENNKIFCKSNKRNFSNSDKNLLSPNEETNDEENSEIDSFYFSLDLNMIINYPKDDIDDIKKFPYKSVGTIIAKFPVSNEIFEYTCFLINSNVVVTLASNLKNKSKGGKATSIFTSFSYEEVRWENIYIQGEEKSNGKSAQNKDKNQKEDLSNLSSKLAVILYDNDISDEWLGVKSGEEKDFDEIDKFVVFSFKREDNAEGERLSETKFREGYISYGNIFFEASQKGEEKVVELIKQSPGSPLFYYENNKKKDVYVIAILNEFFEFQYIEQESFLFLKDMIYKGKLPRNKVNNAIKEEYIYQLNLERLNLGQLELKYFVDFNFKNLRILNLSNNLLKTQGAHYLTKGKLLSLETLNLDFNDIGDEGLKYLSKGYFNKLKNLFLSYNHISFEGIKYLEKAGFVKNLINLSLSGNNKIGDTGVRYLNENKRWEELYKLN